MKRSFFVVLIALIVIAGTGIFAEEVTNRYGNLRLGGSIKSGLFYDHTDDKDEVYPYNDDTGRAFQVDVDFAYNYQNIGANVKLRNSNLAANGFSIVYAYAWSDFFDKKFRITGGYIVDKLWGTAGDLDVYIAEKGFRLEFMPISGLSAGVFFVIPDNEARDTWAWPITGARPSPGEFFSETAFGFKYTNPIFYAGGSLQLDSDFDTDPSRGITAVDGYKKDAEIRALFGVGFTGLKGLTATVEGDIWGLGNYGDQGRLELHETVAYQITDRVKAGVLGVEKLYSFGDLKPWLNIKPSAEYKVNDAITLVLGAGYGRGQDMDIPRSAIADTEKNYQFTVEPKAIFTLAPGLPGLPALEVRTWYEFKTYELKGTDDPALEHRLALRFAVSY
jgi:hypothetical protein